MSIWRAVLLLAGAVLLTASVYVERHRSNYGPEVHLLGGFSFAGGAAGVALALLG